MNNIDLTALPPNAKQEIIDFYQFLIEKYTTGKKDIPAKADKHNSRSSIAPRLVKPFTPLSRDEAHER